MGKAEEPVDNIYQRMLAVTADVMGIVKGDKAPPAAGGYKFVSHSDVTRALRVAFINHGIVALPSIIAHESEVLGTAEKPTYFTRVAVELTFVNVDNPDDRVSAIAWGYGLDRQDKSVGKAHSYAVKYAMLKALCLETPDHDIEADDISLPARANHTPPPEEPPLPDGQPTRSPKTLDKQAIDIMAEFDISKETATALCSGHGFVDMSDEGKKVSLETLRRGGKLRKSIGEATTRAGITGNEFDTFVEMEVGKPFDLCDEDRLKKVAEALKREGREGKEA